MAPRIAVIGAGANGGAAAADLTRAGLDVTLIEQWPANVRAMRERGIRVRMPGEEFTTPVRAIDLCDVATLREPFDVVIVMVKAYDTRWATRLICPLVKPGGLVVGVQNGMTIDPIAEIAGPERTIGCVIEMGGAMWEPGIVERDTPPSKAWFAIGAYDERTRGREGEVAQILSHVGNVQVYADIRAAKWMKLIVNAAEVAPSAILNLPMDRAIATPRIRDFMVEVGHEAIIVARAAGIGPVPIFGMPSIDTAAPRKFVGDMLDMVTVHFGQPHSKVAMLQDWLKGRRGEVEEMNGYVVAEGRRTGAPVAFNARVLRLAREVEAGRLPFAPENLDLLLGRGAVPA
ncbi:MAG TPA: 2-dehydropantoate 2-reductase [Trebonia sp.]|jgi:2-dehydropantoate 2-reductase|nr:2-dehydropantoate 2-reductase [Trebonia sp.]